MDRWAAAGGRVGGGMKAAQLLDIAGKLLDARDLVGSKKFAERAIESDPLLDGAERVLAAADVLLAAQRRRINNHVDWYAVLQLDPGEARDVSAVRLQYRRLALLLRPGHPHSPSADEAFKLVSDAWAVLSDTAKKELYDKELALAAAADPRPNGGSVGGHHSGEDGGENSSDEAEGNDDASFWTACASCFNVHQYARGYEDRTLLCQNCRKAFLAVELASPPPIVPGSDMYFCAWGLFPLGFPGGPDFGWPVGANYATGPEIGRDAAGKPWNRPSFPGFLSWWGAHGFSLDRRGGWVNAEDGNVESHLQFGAAGKRQKQCYGDVGGNRQLRPDVGSPWMQQKQSFSAVNGGKAQGAATSENVECDEITRRPVTSEETQKGTRKKVMAKRPKKPVAGFAGFGIAASREAEVVVNPTNRNNNYIREKDAAKPDGGSNTQNARCSRTVEISAEDLDLNFTIDIDATDNILSSLSTYPFLKDGDVVVVD